FDAAKKIGHVSAQKILRKNDFLGGSKYRFYPNVIFPFIDVFLFFVRITSFILFTFLLYERRRIIDIRLRMRIYTLIPIKFSDGAATRRRLGGCNGREAGRFA